MKITVLIENHEGRVSVFEHGLSLYIKTQNHHLLADAGQSDAIIGNASELGIDLALVDTIVLSHGHYDHSGGIMPLSQLNPAVKVYMQKKAALDYYHDERYIGIDKAILTLPGTVLLDGDCTIDEELSIFTGITGRRYFASSNRVLSRVENGVHREDDFSHEQCLVVSEGGKRILISGCAHNGILNVLDRYKELYGSLPDMVISGFHLMKKTPYTSEEISVIEATARELATMDTAFYTGHCTGDEAFAIMKEIMGEKLHGIYTGMEIL